MHAYDLGVRPGWQEQPPGPTTQPLPTAPLKYAVAADE